MSAFFAGFGEELLKLAAPGGYTPGGSVPGMTRKQVAKSNAQNLARGKTKGGVQRMNFKTPTSVAGKKAPLKAPTSQPVAKPVVKKVAPKKPDIPGLDAALAGIE